MKILYEFVLGDYEKYIGAGAYVTLFFLCMIYIYMTKDKNKHMFLYYPLLMLFAFFNPLFIKVVYVRFFWGTYWRLLWLLPLTALIAYTGTQIIFKNDKLKKKLVVAVAVILVIASGGSMIYNEHNYQKAENVMKIPDEAAVIGDLIVKYSGTWYPRVIVPNELYCYMRQYTSHLRLLYGRNIEGYMGGVDEEDDAGIIEVHEEMSKPNVNVRKVAQVAREYDVQIIVFNTQTQTLIGDPSDYGYGLGGMVGAYAIYSYRGE